MLIIPTHLSFLVAVVLVVFTGFHLAVMVVLMAVMVEMEPMVDLDPQDKHLLVEKVAPHPAVVVAVLVMKDLAEAVVPYKVADKKYLTLIDLHLVPVVADIMEEVAVVPVLTPRTNGTLLVAVEEVLGSNPLEQTSHQRQAEVV